MPGLENMGRHRIICPPGDETHGACLGPVRQVTLNDEDIIAGIEELNP
jgi:hypothetical protein